MEKKSVLAPIVIISFVIFGFGLYIWKNNYSATEKNSKGFIADYNHKTTALEKKKALFETGAIEEIAGTFGFKKGYFTKSNQANEGWSFNKNDWIFTLDASANSPIEIHFFRFQLDAKNLSEIKISNWVTQSFLAQELECFLGFSVHIDAINDSELNLKWYWRVLVPDKTIEVATAEDLISIFSFIRMGILSFNLNSSITQDTLKFYAEEKEKPATKRLHETSLLVPHFAQLKLFSENPATFAKCHSAWSPVDLAARVPASVREQVQQNAESKNKK